MARPVRLLFWFSGEHPALPQAEAAAAFEACGHSFTVLADRPRFQVVETDAFGIDVDSTVRRLGLTHDVSTHIFDGPAADATLAKVSPDQCLELGIGFAVRAERIAGPSPWRVPEAERRVGAVLGVGRHVDLKNPDRVIRAFLDGDHLWVGRQIWDRDPKDTAARHVQNRPTFSPVSLPPKMARALINLARTPPGGLVADPMCGTGGILLEAASMGMRIVGSDLDPAMAEGARRNLEHFGFKGAPIATCDVADAASEYEHLGVGVADAVVMDLPYGRSASTGREALASLHDRAAHSAVGLVRQGGRVVIGVPSEEAVRQAEAYLDLEALYKVRVHDSLTRHFAVMRRR